MADSTAAFTTFGALLRYLRRRARLTQIDLAIATGYSTGQISRLEQNQRSPNPDVVHALFVPALDLDDDAERAARLIELARAAQRETPTSEPNGAAAAQRPALPENGPPDARATLRTPPVSDAVPVVATKLYLPRVRPEVVPRPRLLAQLDAARSVPLTLIAAPAGFGKTTLLATWLHQGSGIGGQGSGRHGDAGDTDNAKRETRNAKRNTDPQPSTPDTFVAWLSLDAGDNDPTTFLRALIAALQAVLPRAGETTLALLQAPQPPPMAHLLPPLLNDLTALPDGSVLVLDDYHVLTVPAVHDAMALLVDYLPPALRLVIASRDDPPLPLARLRARAQVLELRAADLRFTLDETATFLTAVMGLPLAAADIAVLDGRTEGWIAGVQLAALAMRNRSDLSSFIASFTGSHRFIIEYLVAEVFARQPPHLQTFLLHTAILERLCGPLCDAVLGIAAATSGGQAAYSQALLDELERTNLFVVALDDERHWYRYHHLFGEVLRERLISGATADEVQTLHHRASVWYKADGLIAEAVQHALRGRDWEQAASLIAVEAVPMAVRGQIQTVVAWLQQLPDAVVQAHPLLGHAHSLGLMLMGQFDAALAQLDRAEAALPAEPADVLARLARGQLAAQRGHIALMRGDAEQASRLLATMQDAFPTSAASPNVQQMIDLARADAGVYQVAMDYQASGVVGAAVERRAEAAIAAAQRAGNRAAVLNGCTYLATVQQRGGRLRAALATYRRYEALVPHPDAVHVGGMPAYHVGMGELHMEWNDLVAAEQPLTQAIAYMHGALVADAEVCLRGHLALAQVYQARDDGDAARAIIEGFRRLAREYMLFPLLVEQADAVEARLSLRQGRLADATAWASRVGPPRAEQLQYPREVIHLSWARVQIAGGRAEQTRPLLALLLAAAEASARTQSVIEILIVQTLAAAATGDGAGARTTLERALALAAPAGYVRIFVDEGPPMERLLRDAHHAGPMRGYIDLLLVAYGDGHADAPIAPPLATYQRGESLSDREQEVLRLMAQGLSNREIAARLVVGVSTIKKHINNIFGKLGVRSRTEALVRARERGLA